MCVFRSIPGFSLRCLLMIIPLALCPLAGAQDMAVGAMVGEVTGLVEDDEGNLVEPQASIDATVDIESDGSDITAVINGVASCTGGLGMQIQFHATYNHPTKTLTGFYSDVPNSPVLDKEITFINTGGLNWRAEISGNAPSATGTRAYDLALDITLPRKAIFPGEQYPNTKSYNGTLNTTVTVTVPLVIPLLNINESISVDVLLEGRWSAKTVPTDDDTVDLNGNVLGGITGLAPIQLTLNIPGSDAETLSLDVAGTFGGSLFATSPTELTFAGSWAAGTGQDGFGGDMMIILPLDDLANLTSMPFSFDGNFAVDPDIPGVDPIMVPFSASGLFPFNLE